MENPKQRNLPFKPVEELEFTDDFMFCTVLEENKDLCKEIIELLLNISVEDIEYVNKQQTFKPRFETKGIRLDVFVRDSNRIIDLEMQTTIPTGLEKRVRYYQSVMDISELEKGKGYDELKDSYVVFLCLTDPFNEKYPIYTVKQTFEENKNIDYNDGRHVVFFNAAAYKNVKSEKIKLFLEYLSTKNSKDELTNKIDYIVSTTKVKEEFGRNYMIANMRDIMMKKQAYNEGVTDGISQGISQGAEQKAIETAKKMLLNLIPINVIAECTGLPLETIQKLGEKKIPSL